MARLVILGSSNTDMTVRLPALPAPGETVLGGSFRSGPGGKGANQAVAAARAGAEVLFVTSVGDDAFGRQSLDLYRAEGIDVRFANTVEGVPSGVALILVGDRGENMIGVAPGANHAIGPDEIGALPDDLFRTRGVLLVAGLELTLTAVGSAVRRASASGMTVVLNPAPVPGADALAGLGILGLVDVITPNRPELAALSGRETSDDEALRAAARDLQARGPSSVVVTLGSEGCLVLCGSEFRRIPSHRVRAVDTVGAGDAFSASLAVALAEGRTLLDAAAWATAASAIAVTEHGAQTALPRRDAIDRLAATRA